MFDFLKKFVSDSDDKDIKSEEVMGMGLQSDSNSDNVSNEEELVAVIAAAIAASLGVEVPEINIKSIRRVPQYTTPWARMGKIEQLFGKL